MTSEKHPDSLPTIHHRTGRSSQDATFKGIPMKHLSLVILLLQNSTLALMLRYSRVNVDPDQPIYLASTAVFIAEILKFLTCLFVLTYKTKSISRTRRILRKDLIDQPREILKMLVPSGLYALQNNLLFVALSNLEAATFQVTYQLKILSTAIFSVIMLNRKLSYQKWLALFLLMVGVTMVQLQNVSKKASSEDSSEAAEDLGQDIIGPIQNPFIGLIAVLTSCVSSGFAGCYFEKVLKGAETDMWVRNMQLGISGTLFSFMAMFYDRQLIYEGGLLQGYTLMTWMVVANQALGGLLVAIVVKYADNILKGFATSLAIIVSGFISVYFFDFRPSTQFMVGTMVVIFSTYLYGRPEVAVPAAVRSSKK
ncbi:hypothetical protein BGZ80_004729 [Entomortierella chlamydospora]|uniref:Udp-galactose transporter n=1 Tax=Entomortierella chlamydospora TaxID=101097 RepID=A0A9P6MM61_9FUNG|nr:hypothetical protein BGZ79_005459 [Entomortierella chlamydospora]KAG0007375.1 hypothetical protein BGZ80_004729 [Entomortierella chlamydospora]